MKSKRTELTKHYLSNEGAYEKEFSELTNAFMAWPTAGRAKNFVGEVVRAANRLYYEYCNNGNCNARKIKEQDPEEMECPICGGLGYVDDDEDCICEECCGSGYVNDEPEVELNEFYGAFIDLIRDSFKSDNNEDGVAAMDSIKNFIVNEDTDQRSYFSDKNMNRYDLMIDLVAEYAIKHRNDNTPIPNDYKG